MGVKHELRANRLGREAADLQWSTQLRAESTVKLDRRRAERLARWARHRKVPKSDVIRSLIDRAGPIETGEDLMEWVQASEGKGLGLAQKKA